MKFKVDFGHPELLVLCGTYLITSAHFSVGLTILILGLIGGVFRASTRIQKAQAEAEAKEQFFKELNNAGEELGTAFASLLGALNGSGKKNPDGTVH